MKTSIVDCDRNQALSLMLNVKAESVGMNTAPAPIPKSTFLRLVIWRSLVQISLLEDMHRKPVGLSATAHNATPDFQRVRYVRWQADGVRPTAQTDVMQNITKAVAVAGVSDEAVGRAPTPQIAEHAAELLTRLFRGLESTVPLRLWNGRLLKLGNAGKRLLSAESERFTLVFRSPAAVREMAFGRDPLRIAEVYFRDDMDIEGDFFAALGLKDHLRAIRMSWRDRLGALMAALRLLLADRTAHPKTAAIVVPCLSPVTPLR